MAILFLFNVVAESEDDKGINLSMMPVTGNLVFIDIHF